MKRLYAVLTVLVIFASSVAVAEDVKIGLNYPKTGPYEIQGLDQLRAAEMAAEEINNTGGIMGRKIVLVAKDSESKADVAKRNVEELIDKDGVEMVFGGSASSVAIAGGLAAKSRGKIYFGTLTYSNETTGSEGHQYMFRECYNAWMGAKVLAKYMSENFSGKKYFYITADYTWGRTTEESIRKFSNTEDTSKHKGVLTPFPSATDQDFKKALTEAKFSSPDVLVLVLFGDDMVKALKLATAMGLKQKMAMVVPNLTLGMAKSAGPKVMEGVVGAVPWEWNIPYKYNFARGIKFVEDFSARYGCHPSTSGASAYAILYQYKDAVERAKFFDSRQVIAALEDHHYSFLKDEQWWRPFDHQNVQTVYAVKCKPQQEVLKDKYQEDFFEVINSMPGPEAAKTREEWNEERRKANKPLELEW
jgi:ABC-type branched-subunit amino acid transport system substrate-binding protein